MSSLPESILEAARANPYLWHALTDPPGVEPLQAVHLKLPTGTLLMCRSMFLPVGSSHPSTIRVNINGLPDGWESNISTLLQLLTALKEMSAEEQPLLQQMRTWAEDVKGFKIFELETGRHLHLARRSLHLKHLRLVEPCHWKMDDGVRSPSQLYLRRDLLLFFIANQP